MFHKQPPRSCSASPGNLHPPWGLLRSPCRHRFQPLFSWVSGSRPPPLDLCPGPLVHPRARPPCAQAHRQNPCILNGPWMPAGLEPSLGRPHLWALHIPGSSHCPAAGPAKSRPGGREGWLGSAGSLGPQIQPSPPGAPVLLRILHLFRTSWIPSLPRDPVTELGVHDSSPSPCTRAWIGADGGLLGTGASPPLPRLGSGGKDLPDGRGGPVAPDQESQENGEFQRPSAPASDFAAQFGSVTAPGRAPEEAGPPPPTAPAQNRIPGAGP